MDELRAIIYCEFYYLDDILRQNELWEDLYDDYYVGIKIQLEQKYKVDTDEPPLTLDIFNEAYFYCISTLFYPHPENKFEDRYLPFQGAGSEESDIEILATSIAYIILLLSNHRNERSVKRFKTTAEILLQDNVFFKAAQSFVKNNKKAYDYSIELHPIPPEELKERNGHDLPNIWFDLVDFFDTPQDGFEKILSLYKTKRDKLKIIDQLSEAFSNKSFPYFKDWSLCNAMTDVEEMPDAPEELEESHGVFHSPFFIENEDSAREEQTSPAEYATQTTPLSSEAPTPKTNVAKNVGPKSLFLKPEDEAIWEERLTRFFADEINTPLNASEENGVLRCMVWFLYIWEKKRIIISRPNTATIRFLQKCGFTLEAAERTISNVIGRLVPKRDKDTDSKAKVLAFVQNNK